MESYKAEVWNQDKYQLGETPYYLPESGEYFWVDITKGRLWFGSSLISYENHQPDGDLYCYDGKNLRVMEAHT